MLYRRRLYRRYALVFAAIAAVALYFLADEIAGEMEDWEENVDTSYVSKIALDTLNWPEQGYVLEVQSGTLRGDPILTGVDIANWLVEYVHRTYQAAPALCDSILTLMSATLYDSTNTAIAGFKYAPTR